MTFEGRRNSLRGVISRRMSGAASSTINGHLYPPSNDALYEYEDTQSMISGSHDGSDYAPSTSSHRQPRKASLRTMTRRLSGSAAVSLYNGSGADDDETDYGYEFHNPNDDGRSISGDSCYSSASQQHAKQTRRNSLRAVIARRRSSCSGASALSIKSEGCDEKKTSGGVPKKRRGRRRSFLGGTITTTSNNNHDDTWATESVAETTISDDSTFSSTPVETTSAEEAFLMEVMALVEAHKPRLHAMERRIENCKELALARHSAGSNQGALLTMRKVQTFLHERSCLTVAMTELEDVIKQMRNENPEVDNAEAMAQQQLQDPKMVAALSRVGLRSDATPKVTNAKQYRSRIDSQETLSTANEDEDESSATAPESPSLSGEDALPSTVVEHAPTSENAASMEVTTHHSNKSNRPSLPTPRANSRRRTAVRSDLNLEELRLTVARITRECRHAISQPVIMPVDVVLRQQLHGWVAASEGQ